MKTLAVLLLLGVSSFSGAAQIGLETVIATQQIVSNGNPLLIIGEASFETYRNPGHARVLTLRCAGLGGPLEKTVSPVLLSKSPTIWFNTERVIISEHNPIVGIYTCQLIASAWSSRLNDENDNFILGSAYAASIEFLQP